MWPVQGRKKMISNYEHYLISCSDSLSDCWFNVALKSIHSCPHQLKWSTVKRRRCSTCDEWSLFSGVKPRNTITMEFMLCKFLSCFLCLIFTGKRSVPGRFIFFCWDGLWKFTSFWYIFTNKPVTTEKAAQFWSTAHCYYPISRLFWSYNQFCSMSNWACEV